MSSVPPCTELGPGPTVAKTGRRLRVTLARSDAPPDRRVHSGGPRAPRDLCGRARPKPSPAPGPGLPLVPRTCRTPRLPRGAHAWGHTRVQAATRPSSSSWGSGPRGSGEHPAAPSRERAPGGGVNGSRFRGSGSPINSSSITERGTRGQGPGQGGGSGQGRPVTGFSCGAMGSHRGGVGGKGRSQAGLGVAREGRPEVGFRGGGAGPQQRKGEDEAGVPRGL